jgi:hypothetical protein
MGFRVFSPMRAAIFAEPENGKLPCDAAIFAESVASFATQSSSFCTLCSGKAHGLRGLQAHRALLQNIPNKRNSYLWRARASLSSLKGF